MSFREAEHDDRYPRGARLELAVGDAVARERATVAALLHDRALQSLLACSQDLATAAQDNDPESLTYAQLALADGIAELRRILMGLQGEPDIPDDIDGLQQALLLFVADAARRGNFTVDVQISATTEVSHPALIQQLVREFVGNAAKHAQADHVTVSLEAAANHDRLVVQDDGIGMPEDLVSALDGHLGLMLSRQRVRDAGGTLDITETQGGGTTCIAILPHDTPRPTLVGVPTAGRT